MANSSSLVIYDPQAADSAMITVAGYLAGYTGRTREAYTLDIRQFVEWCAIHDLPILEVRRTHIELMPASSRNEVEREQR